jgi:hypothetical protein
VWHAAKQKVIGGVGIQSCPRRNFLDLPPKIFPQGMAQAVILLQKP